MECLTEDLSLERLYPGAEVPRNVIVRALGMVGVRPGIRDLALLTGDTLLLCSSAVSSVMTIAEMATLLRCDDVGGAVASLVSRAAARRGTEDVTAVAVSFVTSCPSN